MILRRLYMLSDLRSQTPYNLKKWRINMRDGIPIAVAMGSLSSSLFTRLISLDRN